MSATIVREKRQTTLPVEVCEPAGIEPGDQIEWRFESGEIRGRKLVPEAVRRVKGKLVRRGGSLILESPVPLEADAIGQAVREERDSRSQSRLMPWQRTKSTQTKF